MRRAGPRRPGPSDGPMNAIVRWPPQVGSNRNAGESNGSGRGVGHIGATSPGPGKGRLEPEGELLGHGRPDWRGPLGASPGETAALAGERRGRSPRRPRSRTRASPRPSLGDACASTRPPRRPVPDPASRPTRACRPDGRLVAFTVKRPRRPRRLPRVDLAVAGDGSAPARRSDAGAAHGPRPRFAPDGRTLAFIRIGGCCIEDEPDRPRRPGTGRTATRSTCCRSTAGARRAGSPTCRAGSMR